MEVTGWQASIRAVDVGLATDVPAIFEPLRAKISCL
jgi:hypothetical protein